MKKSILPPLAFLLACCISGCTDDAGTFSVATGGRTTTFIDGTNSGGSAKPGNSQAGVITAGEWNDLDDWPFWTNLMKNDEYSGYQYLWGFHPYNRYSFLIKDAYQRPVADARIVLKDEAGGEIWAARTDNSGRADLWSGMLNSDDQESQTFPAASVAVSYQNQDFTFDEPRPFDQGVNEISIAATASDAGVIEVMLVVDATGSMGDELEYLKNELYDVLERAQQSSAQYLRTASVFYRDQGDEYVTRASSFTPDVRTTVTFVKNQRAEGGGDFPEAVHAALQNGIEHASWSDNARARLLFLMLDAPPHGDAQVKRILQTLSREAAEAGIKIIPVTASGIDKSTEFLMRFLSITTNGTYVFITDHSGIGNDHLEPTVGEYEVEYLNDLMVRLIREYSQ